MSDKKVIIIGAGPAGMTAAYQLSKVGKPSLVIEKDDVVGGISRTVRYKGYHFDIGGHRFFTKVKAVENLWHEVLPNGDFLLRNRLSRIYYNKKFFYYPLKPLNALFGLGVWNSLLILGSYFWAHVAPAEKEDNFEQWVSNRFGKRLYSIFFKTYTEKVWGIPANEIAAEWAAQRIKGLSLFVALKNAILKEGTNNGEVVKTLIDSFHYPKRGPGMMWEIVADLVERAGHDIRMQTSVERIICGPSRVEGLEIKCNGHRESVKGSHLISTMPIRELIQRLDPPAPPHVVNAAKELKYRDFLTVALIVNKKDLFPDNWIYIHDPEVRVGRIQNFKNWSPYMVPDQTKTCLGLEYFCFEGDGLWTMSDADLVELGKRELAVMGLVNAEDVEDGAVVRMPKAYPVYDGTYRESLGVLCNYLERFENLQVVGRNGMHRYNNQDHSMLTAMLAVENILGANHDLWKVNAEQEYHEEVRREEVSTDKEISLLESTQPHVPLRDATLSAEEKHLVRSFAKMDRMAFATALGIVAGIGVFLASMILVLKGGEVVGPHLNLLGQFFTGYTVSVKGSFIGMAYSFFWAFLWGWLFAYVRNFSLGFVIYRVRKKVEMMSFRNFIDHF